MVVKRLDIEIDCVQLCPYCREKIILKKTCGDLECQYKHHIVKMRLKRKTRQKRSTRTNII